MEKVEEARFARPPRREPCFQAFTNGSAATRANRAPGRSVWASVAKNRNPSLTHDSRAVPRGTQPNDAANWLDLNVLSTVSKHAERRLLRVGESERARPSSRAPRHSEL